MPGFELAALLTGLALGLIAVGWVLHWLWSIAMPRDAIRDAELTRIATDLDRTEAERDEARDAFADIERRMASERTETDDRLAAMQRIVDGAVEGREAQLTADLREARLDAETAMAGLRSARQRIMDLEDALEQRGVRED